MKKIQSAERVSNTELSDRFVYSRSLLAYLQASQTVRGKVLEIGTGMGYGTEMLAKASDYFLTIDKFLSPTLQQIFLKSHNYIEYRKMKVPPLLGIASDTFDFVVSFQVIEHIEDHELFVSEVFRVLKPGGTFIVTTPNKSMSITRNPWHIREYFPSELECLLQKNFTNIEAYGVFGNDKILRYYQENKRSVQKITRFDIFNLQYRLPRWSLQLPYDFLNRMNRKKLLKQNAQLVQEIKPDDYHLAPVSSQCYDLFFKAIKTK